MELDDEIDLEVIHNEIIESIHDSYTGYNTNESIEDGKRTYTTTTIVCNTQPNKERTVVPLATKDVFSKGRQNMIDTNIPLMRERKKLTEQRINVFPP